MSTAPSRVGGPGRALTRRAARAGGFDQVPRQVSAALEGLGLSHLEPTWRALSAKLWRLQRDQARRGGARPGDVKHGLRSDRHLKTVERHLRLLDQAGFLERNPVKGRPRRGPGTRVRYWLPHALNLSPLAAVGRPDDAAPPPAPTTSAEAPSRAPPAEISADQRAANAAAGRAIVEGLKDR